MHCKFDKLKNIVLHKISIHLGNISLPKSISNFDLPGQDATIHGRVNVLVPMHGSPLLEGAGLLQRRVEV